MRLLTLILAFAFLFDPTVAFSENSPRQDNAVYKKALRDYEKGRYEKARLRLETIVINRNLSWDFVPVSWGSPKQYPQNWRKAFALLAHIYENGQGIEPNSDLAKQLYLSALGYIDDKTLDWDSTSGERPIYDVSRAPEAAFGLCNQAVTFAEVIRYCRAFKHAKNADALADNIKRTFALDKLADFVNVEDANLRLARALVLADGTMARDILKSGISPDFQFSVTEYKFDAVERENETSTPLWYAAQSRQVDMFELLLRVGANPNIAPVPRDGRTLLRELWVRRDPYSGRRLALDLLEPLLEQGYVVNMEVVNSVRGYGMDEGRAEEFYGFLDLLPPPIASEARRAEDERWRAFEEKKRKETLQREPERKTELNHLIGMRLCMSSGSFTYVGFVEGSANGKIQIRISYSVYTKKPEYLGPTVQDQIIWDYPSNWTYCNF